MSLDVRSAPRVLAGDVSHAWRRVRRPSTALPKDAGPIARFAHGFMLPVLVLKALWRDRATRARYVRATLSQALVVAGLALLIAKPAEENTARFETARSHQDRATPAALHAAKGDTKKDGSTDFSVLKGRIHVHKKNGHTSITSPEGLIDVQYDDKAKASEAKDADEADDAHEAEAAPPPESGWRALMHRGLLFWAAFFTAVHIAQTIVIALSRDYHSTIGRDAFLALGLAPEDDPPKPRIRLSWKWIKSRVPRQIRGWLVIATGTPVIALVAAPWPHSEVVFAVLTSIWVSYWMVVFCAAKSTRAWDREGTAGDPWFVRGWDALTRSVFGFRWWLPRAYGRWLRRLTRSMFSPAEYAEKAPVELLGLAFFRSLGYLPLVKVFTRPLIPVAAGCILDELSTRPPVGQVPVGVIAGALPVQSHGS